MGVGKMLQGEMVAWGTLAMIIVLVMIILGKFKDVQSQASGNTTGIIINQTIDSTISGLKEPSNWVTIFVIALIGGAIIWYFTKKQKMG